MISPYAKAALLTIRLAACSLMIWSLMLYGPDLYSHFELDLHLKHRPRSTPVVLALKAIPALAGAVLLWRSRAMAISLTKDLD